MQELTRSTNDLLEVMKQEAKKVKIKYSVYMNIICGLNLPKADVFSKSDPYCIIKAHPMQYTTKTIDNTLNPKWNESLEFIIDPESVLFIECWDANTLTKDKLIGKTQIKLTENMNENIYKAKLDSKGEIHFNIKTKKRIYVTKFNYLNRLQSNKSLKLLTKQLLKIDPLYANKQLNKCKIEAKTQIINIKFDKCDYQNYFKGKSIYKEDNDKEFGMKIKEICNNEYGNELKKIGLENGYKLKTIDKMNIENVDYKIITNYLQLKKDKMYIIGFQTDKYFMD